MSSKFETFRRVDGQWAWRLRAGNGEIIATDGGQGYVNEGDCRRVGLAVVQGLYAPTSVELSAPAEFPEGQVVIDCPDPGCDAGILGFDGELLEHLPDGVHRVTRVGS